MEVGSSSLPGTTSDSFGGLAQLARAPALQAGGQRFESVILHLSSSACSLQPGQIIKFFVNSSINAKLKVQSSKQESFFDILTHKTVSKDLKFKTELYLFITSQFTAESMSYYGERKTGRLVDALAPGGDEGRDKLR